MRDNPRRDKVFAFISWVLVVALLFAGVQQALAVSSGLGPVASLLGVVGSKVFYCVLYFGEALALAYSKFFKKKKMRKIVLMVIYLTGFFTTALYALNIGVTIKLLDNLLISVVAAVCWLYWTFRTEYIDRASFIEDVNQLRDDCPPNC